MIREPEIVEVNDDSNDDLDSDPETGFLNGNFQENNRISRHRTHNSHSVNMTPPDELLLKSLRKLDRLSSKPKVYVRERIRIAALTRIVYGDCHWKLAEAYSELATSFLDKRELPLQAFEHAQTARSIMLNNVNGQEFTSDEDRKGILETLFCTYLVLGRAQSALNKLPEAEQSLSKSDGVWSKLSELVNIDSDHVDQLEISISTALARLYNKLKKYRKSNAQFERAREATQRQYGANCSQLVALYKEMGTVEQSRESGSANNALDMFVQSHDIAQSVYPAGSLQLADSQRALGMAYLSASDTDEVGAAEKFLNEALAIYQTELGPNHATTISIMEDIVRLLLESDRQQEALKLLQSVYDAKCETFGDYSAEIAVTHQLLGTVHLSEGNFEKSLKSLKKALEMQTIVHGPNSKKVKDLQSLVDSLMMNPALANRVNAKQSKTSQGLANRPRFSAFTK